MSRWHCLTLSCAAGAAAEPPPHHWQPHPVVEDPSVPNHSGLLQLPCPKPHGHLKSVALPSSGHQLGSLALTGRHWSCSPSLEQPHAGSSGQGFCPDSVPDKCLSDFGVKRGASSCPPSQTFLIFANQRIQGITPCPAQAADKGSLLFLLLAGPA